MVKQIRRNEPITVYQMKVTLKRIHPPIWRRFLVTGDRTLYRLHLILQSVMGWDNYHLYEFSIGGKLYGIPDEDWEYQPRNARSYRIEQVLREKGESFLYIYDMGDYWEHELEVERIFSAKPNVPYPVCLEGERACPPEDCGSVSGYKQLLAILANPQHEEHESMRLWTGRGEEYDPEAFSLRSVNRELRFHWQMLEL